MHDDLPDLLPGILRNLPAAGKPITTDTLPACPVCGAAARQLAPNGLRAMAAGGAWPQYLLDHDCDCDIDHATDYQLGVSALHMRAVRRARFMKGLATRHRAALSTRLIGPAEAAERRIMGVPRGTFIYLWGEAGVGKTTLAIRAAYRRIDQQPAAFISAAAWLESIRASYNHKRAPLDPDDVSVLVLDDIGKERPTAWAAERLFTLVDAYWSKQQTMICTSQYPPDQTSERIYTQGDGTDAEAGKALMSRLASGLVLRIRGQDQRLLHLAGAS